MFIPDGRVSVSARIDRKGFCEGKNLLLKMVDKKCGVGAENLGWGRGDVLNCMKYQLICFCLFHC